MNGTTLNNSPGSSAKDFFQGREFLIFSLCLLSLVAVVFKDFLLFNKVYLFKDIGSDSINGFYPNTLHLIDYLRTEGIPRWSFNRGMGQNIFPTSLSDPSMAILIFFGRENLAYGVIVVEVLKVIAAGTFFFLYLRTLRFTPLTTIIGGLLYAFSGYLILTSAGWYNHSFEPVFLAMLLYSFEQFFQRRVVWLLPLALAITVSYQPLLLYQFGLFLFGYAVVRFFQDHPWQGKHLALVLGKLVGLMLVGVGIGSVFFLTNLLQMVESPRLQGNLSFFSTLSSQTIVRVLSLEQSLFIFARAFSVDFLGTGDSFRGWGNYFEAPVLYCGLASLVLAPQALFFTRGKQRMLIAIVSVVWLLPLFFPFFRYLFWGFTGSYFRTLSLLLTVVLLLLALYALRYLEREGKLERLLLAGTLIIIASGLYAPLFAQREVLDGQLRIVITVFIFLYCAVFLALTTVRWKSHAKVGMLALVCLELGWFSWISVNKRDALSSQELKQRVGYNDETVDALQFLRSVDNSFYRVEKDYSSGPAAHLSLNDAQVQKYFGTACYHSFNQPSYIAFLQAVELMPAQSEPSARWSNGLRGSPRLQSLASVKYFLTRGDTARWVQKGYRWMHTVGGVNLLKNEHALPLGVTLERYALQKKFAAASRNQKEQILLRAFVIDEKESERFRGFEELRAEQLSDPYTAEAYANDVEALRADTLSVEQFGQNTVRGTITLDKKKMLLFSIPFDKGWTAKVDGAAVPLERVDIGFMGLVLEKGEHRVELEYRVPSLILGASLSGVFVVFYFGLIVLSARRTRSRLRAETHSGVQAR